MTEQESQQSESGRTPRVPAWKKGLLGIALVLTAVGGGFAMYDTLATPSGVPSEEPRRSKGAEELQPRELNPEEGRDRSRPELPAWPGEAPRTEPEKTEPTAGSDGAAGAEGESLWPAALFRLGFGFFVGFSIGYAIRVFVRIALVAVGLAFLLLFGLQYGGLIPVDWSAMGTVLDQAVAWVRANAAGFRAFITGQLPSAASALAGAAVGFKK